MIRASAITGVDHTLVGVRDLEAARAAWAKIGFRRTPRGRHIGWGTGNYCIMLEQGYIELLGVLDPAQFTNNLDKFLAEREGLLGLAFHSRDNDQTATWLAAGGFMPDGPKDLKRALELEEGEVLPAFRLLFLPPQETPGVRAFFCQHLTPDLIRRGPWLVHAIGAVSLKAVITVVERPGDLASAYARLFGAGAISGDGDSLRVDCGEGELLFVTHEGLQRLYPAFDLPRRAEPWIAAMRIGVLVLADAADYLDSRQVKSATTARGVAVLPDQANGAIVEFVADAD